MLCHVCGRPCRSLGAHIRVRGMAAAEYRREYGLLRTRALSARTLSQRQSRTRRAAYEASGETRTRFTAGRAMAPLGRADPQTLGPHPAPAGSQQRPWPARSPTLCSP
ncbi:MucR family transcriptional regulator [Streptomyces sp. FL07-04A]|uniref:MucR family transcriptional regulator n=1 Tax=Streptomyces sp. FL07-04A TaxID=3028658 RepID=UPI0039F662A3